MKPIIFSRHALEHLRARGASKEEIKRAIREGERIPAKKGRLAFRKNFFFNSEWKGKHYEVKQVMPIVIDKNKQWLIVTVYVFYFGGKT